MLCPQCGYMMDAFDKECLRCHGKGLTPAPEAKSVAAKVVQAPAVTEARVTPTTAPAVPGPQATIENRTSGVPTPAATIVIPNEPATDASSAPPPSPAPPVTTTATVPPSAAGSYSSVPQRPVLPPQVTDTVQDTWEHTLQALKILIRNPVHGLPLAYRNIAPEKALAVGIGFGVLCNVLVFAGFLLAVRRENPVGFLLRGQPSLSESIRPAELIKLLVVCAAPLVSMAAGAILSRLLLRGTGRIEGDVFWAGAALLPMSFVVLLSGILGVANIEVIIVCMVFAICYTIMMIHKGCSDISGIAAGPAAFAVPLCILLSGWAAKIIGAAMF